MFVKSYNHEEERWMTYFFYKGKIRGEFIYDDGTLWNLKIYDKYRGRGYGNKMIAKIIKKYSYLNLFVESNNTIALHLYQKYGFKTTDDYGRCKICFMERGNR